MDRARTVTIASVAGVAVTACAAACLNLSVISAASQGAGPASSVLKEVAALAAPPAVREIVAADSAPVVAAAQVVTYSAIIEPVNSPVSGSVALPTQRQQVADEQPAAAKPPVSAAGGKAVAAGAAGRGAGVPVATPTPTPEPVVEVTEPASPGPESEPEPETTPVPTPEPIEPPEVPAPGASDESAETAEPDSQQPEVDPTGEAADAEEVDVPPAP